MISVFELFKISIGPSSSHTMGPMLIAGDVLKRLQSKPESLKVHLHGSLAATGLGHATDKAVFWGLTGLRPDMFDAQKARQVLLDLEKTNCLQLAGLGRIHFDPDVNLVWHKGKLPPDAHPNMIRFVAEDSHGASMFDQTYYSVGGGFFSTKEAYENPASAQQKKATQATPYPFANAATLLELSGKHQIPIEEIVFANECASLTPGEVDAGLERIWKVMEGSLLRGLRAPKGPLPGKLRVQRRAPALFATLKERSGDNSPERFMDFLNVYAMAVNEENAAGGQVVTAPTNGAAGIIPAVMAHYCRRSDNETTPEAHFRAKRKTFLLTAAAIGALYKQRASISGAEMGCQGEVGVACSMAAAGLAAVWEGTSAQIEHAAEIGMEHNLGLTCDPVAGLVQIPCIERNAIGTVKAVNAARLALRDTSPHKVTLDQVIETMRQTGLDMSTKYKETSAGGLAKNVIEC